MKLIPVKSKKGITLVEAVIAVVVLGVFATGVLTMLTTGGTKIAQISREGEAHAIAMQRLDAVISAMSNDATNYINLHEMTGEVEGINVNKLKEDLQWPETDLSFNFETALYSGTQPKLENVRGWYITLSYQGQTVRGFTSYTQGVFDK